MSQQPLDPSSRQSSPPTTYGDRKGWQRYWLERGEPWRTEPEIGEKRKKFLEGRRNMKPGIRTETPFAGIQLSRSDVEWLLATRESSGEPSGKNRTERQVSSGLNLYGADLRWVNLRNLPLAGSNLAYAQLQKAALIDTNLKGADLSCAQLQEADLRRANLRQAKLVRAELQGALLQHAHLEGAHLGHAELAGANLRNCFFDSATNLHDTSLGDQEQGFASVANIHWGKVNLAGVRWPSLKWWRPGMLIIGDEWLSQQGQGDRGEHIPHYVRANRYFTAVHANRQLANELRIQDMNEQADYFSYRAQQVQESIYRRQRQIPHYILSLLLRWLTGYGFRIERIFIAYVLIVLAFATAYWILGYQDPPVLKFWQAVIVSVTAFHGRVFANLFTLNEPQDIVTALEAIFGLVVEGVFIAMLTQRFFGK